MNGFLLIDKPEGCTSHHALTILKRRHGFVKLGHTGTLDPFANGLLIVAAGEATKFIPYLKNEPKEYEAVLSLGEETDTLDRDGAVVLQMDVPLLRHIEIERCFKELLGVQKQIPPMYSAKKRNGERLYNLARAGKTVERVPSTIHIHDLSLKEYAHPTIRFGVLCSAGTYIRVIGQTVAEKLGTVGHLTSLRRTRIGDYSVKEAIAPEVPFNVKGRLIPMDSALGHLTKLDLPPEDSQHLMCGRPIAAPGDLPDHVPLMLIVKNHFVGIGKKSGGELRSERLMKVVSQ